MPQIEKKAPSRRSKENPVSAIDFAGKSVDELRDALAELQVSMRAKCLAAFGYDEAKTARLIDEFAEMSRRLEDKQLTDLERLTVEQIITCWIQTTVTGYRLEGLSDGQQGGRMASFLEHRHNMAHNRLLRSMDQLARLRGFGIVDLPSEQDAPRRLTVEVVPRGKVDPPGRTVARVSKVSKMDPALNSRYDEMEVIRRVDDPFLTWE